MTFSRLTLGEPHLKGKPSGGAVAEPCVDEFFYGDNILSDPGFENFTSLGLTDNAIPRGGFYDSDAVEKTTGVVVPPADCEWNTQGTNHPWEVESTDPHSGTHHLEAITAGGINSTALYMVKANQCGLFNFLYTTRITPGDYVRLSLWAKGIPTSGGTWNLDINLNAVPEDWSQDDAMASLTVPLTSTWTQYEVDAIVPATLDGYTPFWFKPFVYVFQPRNHHHCPLGRL